MKKRYAQAILCFLMLTFLSACTTIFDEIETNGSFNPKIAIPLIETQYRLEHFMKGIGVGASNNMYIRPDGQFEIQYKGNFSEARTINVLATLPNIITIPAPFDPLVITPFPNPTGMKLDYIDVKKGKFKWTMTNNKADEAMVTLTFYSLSKNTIAFDTTFSIQSGLTVSSDIDLKDAHLTSTESGKMIIGYKAFVKGAEERLSNVAYEISGLEAKVVVGYFGQFPIGLKPEALDINFFEQLAPNNNIHFSDPTLSITIENGFGFPCTMKTLAEFTQKNGSKSSLTSPLNAGVTLKYPALNDIGSTQQTVLTLNKQNSNIADILTTHTHTLAVALEALSNPDATKRDKGFTQDNSGLRFKMDLTIPFTPTVKNFTFFDTLDINLSDLKRITDAEFKAITDNTLPFDLGIQAYFLSSNTIIDSLVANNNTLIVKSAETFKGQVVGMTTSTTFINLDATKFNFIKNSTRMVVKFTVSTAVQGSVPVYLKADQSVFMRIGVRAKT